MKIGDQCPKCPDTRGLIPDLPGSGILKCWKCGFYYYPKHNESKMTPWEGEDYKPKPHHKKEAEG